MGTWDDLLAGKRRAEAMKGPKPSVTARIVGKMEMEKEKPEKVERPKIPHEHRSRAIPSTQHGLTPEEQRKVKAILDNKKRLLKTLEGMTSDAISKQLQIGRNRVRAFMRLQKELEGK